MIFNLLIAWAVVFPMNGFFDGQLAKSAVLNATSAWRAVHQGNSMHAILVTYRIGFNAQARMKTTILEKIAGEKFAGVGDLLCHVRSRSA